MRYLLIIVAALALVGTAQAAAPAKLSISPKRVDADERFELRARNFTPNATMTVFYAITGEAAYASITYPVPSAQDGSWSVPLKFQECRHNPDGSDVSADLTLTLVDSFGVQDSARLVVC